MGSKDFRALVVFLGIIQFGPRNNTLQLVEIVKLTVILAWVSTASSPM